ncbi:MAG TPA: MFS transporter [Syntrophobacteraceae bacterium]|nr:MFS transporter [Syntrophobacteraceae bacterium]HBZ56040.1 MFS transporter [Syntrophobacteraceae bacterium]
MRRFNLKVLVLLSFGHMVVDIYQGALPAILPFFKENLGLSYAVTGTILIVANISSSIVQPLFGFLSDRRAKGFLLPLGALLAGAGFSLLSTTNRYPLILCLVAVSGLGIAAYHPEGFKTARFFTGERMATGMSVFSVGGNTGMALGPILALSIVHYQGYSSLPWMILPALGFTAVIMALQKVVAIPGAEESVSRKAKGERPKGTRRAMLTIIGVIIMRTWTQLGLMTYIPFYYINALKGDPVFAGRMVSLLLVGGAFGTLAGSPLADRWGHRFWLRFSMLGSALLFPLLFYAQGYLLLVVVTLLGTILISTFSVTVVMGQNLFPDNLGVASGLLVGFAIGAGGIGVTLLGIIADHFGVYFALKCIGVLPLAGFLLSLLLRYPVKQPLPRYAAEDSP